MSCTWTIVAIRDQIIRRHVIVNTIAELMHANGGNVSPYAAPARATDLSGLPETYVDVGDLDILRDENIEYARRLMAAGVPTELHVVPGLPHGFEMAAPDAAATQRVMASRLRRFKLL
jgi:acetyl esterase/lipase